MRLWVDPGKVGNESAILMTLRNQEQPVMSVRLIRLSVPSGNGNAEFQRHVKASQLLTTLAVAPRQIMDRILGRKNRPRDPLRARLGNAPRLQGAARHKTAAHRGKHDGVEKRGKLSVVGTVYENRLIRIE